ncbi:energy transducer TonB [Pedobacter frigidisoli]|uniref:Energy transducer TonB n=1 Tax=Pedobacter frigidisoli TaxID=2530455 RepID=A0A4R0P6X2_9SPHI|nr:energy transducer TonB [Pedobacter frigidisoli]TCD12701.1 energy transducer TonB [Pedobacter frigidisoli]
MRKLIFLALMGFAMLLNPAKAQDQEKIYDFVSIEKQPNFPGGMQKFYEYLGKEIKYPDKAKVAKTQGKVFLTFVVEKEGTLSGIEVIRGLTEETNNEAIRVIKNSPKWNPGIQKGKAVRVKYNIAVNFSLSPKGTEKKANVKKANQKFPEYPGGQAKLYSYLAKNVKYPEQAKKDKM